MKDKLNQARLPSQKWYNTVPFLTPCLIFFQCQISRSNVQSSESIKKANIYMNPLENRRARPRILDRLRASEPFEDAPPRPAHYLPVTNTPDGDLVMRFTAEVERLSGKVHTVSSSHAAIEAVFTILNGLGNVSTVMAWADLPIPELLSTFASRNVDVNFPKARAAERQAALIRAEPIRVGLTGVDAAFATTGTLALVTNERQGRLPSLLPPVHIALLRRDRLYGRLEDWLSLEGRTAMLESNSIAFITGPSRTSDIEMQTILGVHGPGVLHIIVFNV